MPAILMEAGRAKALQTVRMGASRITLVIEHDMDFVREFATSVTVLAAGKVLSEGSVAEVEADRKVQEVYLGTAGGHFLRCARTSGFHAAWLMFLRASSPLRS